MEEVVDSAIDDIGEGEHSTGTIHGLLFSGTRPSKRRRVKKLQDITVVPEDLSFQFIREITDDFSEERIVGEGTFGVVYKGVTKDGQDVAVKKLKPCHTDPDNKQFRNEFDTLTKLKHQNIVKILGYCYETEKKPFIMPDGSTVFVDEINTALCFEYMQNGSLQKQFDEPVEVKLDWLMRFKIIKGICEGLKYMHVDLEKHVYHFDLKPGNILLDKDMIPKIADFGLSRIFGQDIIRTTDNMYGTLGYLPPEYIDRREISGKFDIFSLGAIIKMIVSRPMGDPECSDSTSSDDFIDQVREYWRKEFQEACSSSDSLLQAYCRQVETCTQIALNCLDEDSQKRPDIVKITEKLNGIEVDVGKLPEKGCGISFSEMTVHNNSIEMRKESKDITVQHQNTDLLSSPSCTNLELIDARETSIDVLEELIVGREEEKGKIISLLESSSTKISIFPIHGIGGIGKTTFARLIYNDPKFKCYSKAWVHVSQRFDLNKILESIISQLSEKENQANERYMVHSSLTKLPPSKKMIVLDDLWEDNQFQLTDLQNRLYHDDSKIIVLVTTRSERVAERIWINLQPYKILPLTNDMCWDIIKQRSGFEARDDKEKLRGMGHEIAQKCAGVALAAQSLGFTLQGMNFDQWMEVKDNDIWKEHIPKDISVPNHVLASLMLSYRYMDPCLQLCFTYCAIFPKGHWIVKDDLIYQWISLGFIEPTELLSVVDLCKKYIMQLQGLSFLQESPKSAEASSEKATIFTMHDLVHDLAVSLSLVGNKLLDKSKQENVMGKSKDYQYAVLRDCSIPLWSTCAAELIALRFLDCRSTELHGAAFAPAMSLRILDLSECYIKMLPDSIAELKELRYLNAPGTRELLPECITKLSHLIYLNLHGSSISALPESIGEMKDLMHLDLSDCKKIMRLPHSFMSLEKLVHLDLSNCHLTLYESESWRSLGRLEHLSLSGCRIEGDLANALCGLTELQYLDLSEAFCYGNLCSVLQQVLVRFTKLRYLDVGGVLYMSYVENFMEAISSLSSLEYLNLRWNRSLYNIPETIGNLRKLRTLDLSYCVNLKRLPASISGIHNMKFLHVSGCKRLDKSTLPLYKNVAMLLPYFVVHAGESESSSNLCQLEYENPTKLEMSGLENVKSTREVQRIKLVEKQRIEELGLVWNRDAKRFVVDDKDILEQLVPPYTVRQIRLQGYNSAGFPSWMMEIATYLPCLVDITMEDMPNCSSLPPLGQLPNLLQLRIRRMDSIRKIGQDLYGDGGFEKRAFPRLWSFTLQEMKCLDEWSTSYSYPSAGGDDDSGELMFPNLQDLFITNCPMLRFKCLSPLALRKRKVSIIISGGQFIVSSQFDASSSAATTCLRVQRCEAPLHQWSLLRHLPHLTELSIDNCIDLTCSSTDLLCCAPSLKALSVGDCKSIAALPERLGDLTSLKTLEISDCEGVKALPESIQQLTRLERLTVKNCKSIVQLPEKLGDLTSLKNLEISNCEGVKALPESIQELTHLQCLKINRCAHLVRWCRSEENKMKIAHIKLIILDLVQSKVISIRRLGDKIEVAGRPETERHKGTGDKKKREGQHQCSICLDYGYHWQSCKRGRPEDIEAMNTIEAAAKKRARMTKCAQSSIMPLEDGPSATMILPTSQNLVTSTSNKRRRSEDCTPETSKSHSLEVSSKKKGNQTNSNSGHSKLSRSGSNQPEALSIAYVEDQLVQVKKKQKVITKKLGLPKKKAMNNPKVPPDSPSMGTRSKKGVPSSPAMGTRSKRRLSL